MKAATQENNGEELEAVNEVGPKVAQAVQSFLGQIDWGQLDYLIIDHVDRPTEN